MLGGGGGGGGGDEVTCSVWRRRDTRVVSRCPICDSSSNVSDGN